MLRKKRRKIRRKTKRRKVRPIMPTISKKRLVKNRIRKMLRTKIHLIHNKPKRLNKYCRQSRPSRLKTRLIWKVLSIYLRKFQQSSRKTRSKLIRKELTPKKSQATQGTPPIGQMPKQPRHPKNQANLTHNSTNSNVRRK